MLLQARCMYSFTYTSSPWPSFLPTNQFALAHFKILLSRILILLIFPFFIVIYLFPFPRCSFLFAFPLYFRVNLFFLCLRMCLFLFLYASHHSRDNSLNFLFHERSSLEQKWAYTHAILISPSQAICSFTRRWLRCLICTGTVYLHRTTSCCS